MASLRDNCELIWRQNPNLAFAFVDFNAFVEATATHRLDAFVEHEAMQSALEIITNDSLVLARERLQFLRRPAQRSADCPVWERIGSRLIIWLYGPIGDAPCLANAETLCNALQAHRDAQAVVLRIASSGGSAVQSLQIADAIKTHPGRSIAIVDKFAMSGATIIATSCDRILMRSDASWMMHNAQLCITGTADACFKAVLETRWFDRQIETHYRRQRRIDIHELRALMRDSTHLNAQQAQQSGFVDQIIPSLPLPIMENENVH